jgi:transglutaminase-like putative cysteine protease
MRIRISHETIYRYDTPAKSAIEILRLTPRNHDGQYIVRWRIELNVDCRLDPFEDAFGNIAHSFTVDGPLSELVIRVDGEVETQDTAGIINGAMERFPPSLYLRETPLTAPDAAIAAFAQETMNGANGDPLTTLHALTARIYDEFVFDPDPTQPAMSAAESFAQKRGVCQDYAQIFIAAARHLGIPARYVSGYFLRVDGVMCGSRSASTRSRPHPCAALVPAERASSFRSRSVSTKPGGRRRAEPAKPVMPGTRPVMTD